jgi:hypothetical protein
LQLLLFVFRQKREGLVMYLGKTGGVGPLAALGLEPGDDDLWPGLMKETKLAFSAITHPVDATGTRDHSISEVLGANAVGRSWALPVEASGDEFALYAINQGKGAPTAAAGFVLIGERCCNFWKGKGRHFQLSPVFLPE